MHVVTRAEFEIAEQAAHATGSTQHEQQLIGASVDPIADVAVLGGKHAEHQVCVVQQRDRAACGGAGSGQIERAVMPP
jgi:hypothetical protein